MIITRVIDGKEHEIQLTITELIVAYNKMKDKFDREDFMSRLYADNRMIDYYNSIQNCDKNDFILDVLAEYRDTISYNEDWKVAMDNAIAYVIDDWKREGVEK